jgi:hypothetical protein
VPRRRHFAACFFILVRVRRSSRQQPLDRAVTRLDRWDALVGLALLALAMAVYLPFAVHGGWYYDDWALYAALRNAPSGSLVGHFDACRAAITGGRSFVCVYHVTVFTLFGSHRTAYHLWAIGFLVVLALLGYRVLCWCRLPRPWAALAAALLISYPASDATRLWPVAAVAQYVLVLQLSGLLLGLAALGRAVRWRGISLHVASGALSVLAMVTYEIAVPLVALNGLVYLAAYRSRRVLWRGAVDLGLAAGFVLYRAVIAPPGSDTGFVVHRDVHGDIERIRTLLHGAWTSWSTVFAPSGALALLGLVTLLAAAVTGAVLDEHLRRRLLPWATLTGAGVAYLVLCALVFITANDLYVPDSGSTFNRLNAPGALAACAVFVGLLGLMYVLVRQLAPSRAAAPALVALVAVAVASHQLGISGDHKRAWEDSWRIQTQALAGYRHALADVPRGASIVGFDTPVWERHHVPIFAATWDLRGALAFDTHVDPPVAMPAAIGIGCGAHEVEILGRPAAPYVGASPLYFVSPSRGMAIRVVSRAICEQQVRRWGIPPLFA